MKNLFKDNFVIILSFSLPLFFIIFFALSIYLHSFFVFSNYNFVYAACVNDYSYLCVDYLKKSYSVIGGKIVLNAVDKKENLREGEVYLIRIFLHDTKKNQSREISLDEAQKFRLSSLLTSPDGFNVTGQYGNGSGFILFYNSGSYNYYLVKDKNKKRLNLVNLPKQYNNDNFYFLGWVLSDTN